MKICFKCSEKKPFESFYKHKAMADGYLNKCITCARNDANKHRHNNIDRIREGDRVRGCRTKPEATKAWRTKYPQKHKAEFMVGNRVRSGKIIPQPCEICGAKKTHAHHDDYAKPLEVRWLCPIHHRAWHDENGEGKNGSKLIGGTI